MLSQPHFKFQNKIKNLHSSEKFILDASQFNIPLTDTSKKEGYNYRIFFSNFLFCHEIKTNCCSHPMTIDQEAIMPRFIVCHNIITSQKGFKNHKMSLKMSGSAHFCCDSTIRKCVFYVFNLFRCKHYPMLMRNHELLIGMSWLG